MVAPNGPRSAPASNGATYNLETDIRAFEGEYIVDGVVRRGSFALIWIDLFDPGSGSQLHDFNGGILPSGLFWTVDVRKSALDFRMNNRRAVLHVRNLPVIDTLQFFGPNDAPALVDFRVEWKATGPAVLRGMGSSVEPTNPAAFLGEIAPAVSVGSFSREELGFEFESHGDASTSPAATPSWERNETARFCDLSVAPSPRLAVGIACARRRRRLAYAALLILAPERNGARGVRVSDGDGGSGGAKPPA